MSLEAKQKIKDRLHPRNRNRDRYDLKALIDTNPTLATHIKPNKYGEDSLDFAHPAAVKLLNQALLNHYYGIKNWDFPDSNLCPPIPGRADYLHYIADLLSENNYGKIPTGSQITCFDIGVGASCIYPIIGVTEYGWNFIGSDVDPEAINSATQIVNNNPTLSDKVECRLQKNTKNIFLDIIGRDEKIDVCICNPPFHATAEVAQNESQRKVKNLTGKDVKNPILNFSGVSHELIYEGGEAMFLRNMVRESDIFSDNCLWFTSLVSKQSNLKGIYKSLDKYRAVEVKTIPMGTGNKSSRIVAWTFMNKKEQGQWREARWSKVDL